MICEECGADGARLCLDCVAKMIGRTPLEQAAPDLLAALERAVEHAENHDDYDWIGAAVAAVARAKGG